MTFQALLLTQADGKTHAEIAQVDESQLPADGNVLVAVDYSTINFKDGLAITGRSPVVRKWPMVAGIDGAGTVLQSADPRWKAGDRVVLNGFGVGETHWGCLAQRARLKGEWLVRCPTRSPRARPWRSARPATRRCCRCWRWSAAA
jgi:acrylyl-CoA reductase (NADPH)